MGTQGWAHDPTAKYWATREELIAFVWDEKEYLEGSNNQCRDCHRGLQKDIGTLCEACLAGRMWDSGSTLEYDRAEGHWKWVFRPGYRAELRKRKEAANER